MTVCVNCLLSGSIEANIRLLTRPIAAFVLMRVDEGYNRIRW